MEQCYFQQVQVEFARAHFDANWQMLLANPRTQCQADFFSGSQQEDSFRPPSSERGGRFALTFFVFRKVAV
jgi:hypothetical protein